MLYFTPAYIPPAIVQPLLPEKAAQTTKAPFTIASTPIPQETNTPSTPAKNAESNLSPLPEGQGESSAAELGVPINGRTSGNELEQFDFFNSNAPVNLGSSNLNLNIYPVDVDDSTANGQASLERSNPATSSTTLVPSDSDALNPEEKSATESEALSPIETLLPQESEIATPPTHQSPIAKVPEGFSTFLVGIKVNNRNAITTVLVRGKEEGEEAIDFENWLLPYEAVVQALKLSTKVLPDNQIELRSPTLVIRVDPSKLQTDPELGLVFSVADLRTLFGVEVEFNINDYAVSIQAPWLDRRLQTNPSTTPVQLEGLPRIAASDFSLAAIEQRIDARGTQTISPNYIGDLSAVGSIFGGSWFIRANQPDLFSAERWRIAEARFQRQTDAADYIIGSQPPFWRSQSPGDYWGFTTIQRNGFIPKIQLYGGSDPRQRLQAAQVGRTISGEAEPGTLVRLVQGYSDRPIAQVLVDSSGIYRFEDIEYSTQGFNNYRVLLYRQGRLTEPPEIRSATFSIVPGRIPAGSSAFAVSAGWRREFSGFENQGLLGNFTDFQGGVLGRWGVSNSLTLGAGVVYDESLRGLAELFFQPDNFPLKVAVSALTGTDDSDWDINADVLFEPSRNFSARLTSDRFATRLNAYWQLSRSLTLLAGTSSNDATEAGVQLAFSGKNSFTFARATFDTKSRFRWNLIQRLDRFELTSLGNESGSQSELSYHLNDFSTGHSLVLGYDTRNQNSGDNLASLSWRYTSEGKSVDGNPLWDAQLGYGMGSQGSGIIASLGTTVIPGLRLQARYQQVSVTSDESAFSLNLVSSVNFQQGITPGDRRADYFRTQGGLLIQTFFDRNQNGKRDPGEKYYTDSNLLIVNNQPIKSLRAQVEGDRISMHLPPGTYRIDLDPAGFPLDWQAVNEAYAVNVVAGSYTPVLVPLVQSYTISGIVTDDQGKPVNGARVEAIQLNSGVRSFSVTNEAGVYYLERLQQGTYTLQINGKPTSPNSIELRDASEAYQELNLKKL